MYYSLLSLKYDQSILVKILFSKRTSGYCWGKKLPVVLFTVKSLSNSREQIIFFKNQSVLQETTFSFLRFSDSQP